MSCPDAVGRAGSASPPEPPRRDQTLPRLHRITSRADFMRVYDAGRKSVGRSLVLFGLPTDRGETRLGLTVVKKFGDSVERNRVKRRLRDIFRRHRIGLPASLDIVVNVRQGAGERSYLELEREFLDQVERLARRARA